MEPEKMEPFTNQWWPMPVSTEIKPDPVPPRLRPRPRRGASRRARSEANRTMLEMLRALAQSEAEASPNLNANVGSDVEEPPGSGSDLPADQVEIPHEPVSPGHLPAGMSGLMLLRATILGPEPDDTELHCRYCNRVFHLQDGGACFEGNAACADCEQRLNRDLVLPAVSKHRPHVYQVCDVASGPDHPKRPAWARKGLPGTIPNGGSKGEDDDDPELTPVPVEDLQQA